MTDAGDNQQEAERRSDETESRSIKEPKEKEDEDENPQDQIQSKERMRQSSPYPVRPGKKDCQFYLKNGLCRYRSSCRFNHPTQLPKELLDRVRVPICKAKTSLDSVEPDSRKRLEGLENKREQENPQEPERQRTEAQDNLQFHQQQEMQSPQSHTTQQQQSVQTPRQHQLLASHFNLYPLVENLTDVIEAGTRDQNSDALVTELSSHFDKC
ncbi:unnamed protein product [Arabidopsis thaliana]|uniref:(thale cress) hypothetical protein n=1 Tax=Arabidopsis thaliana TaxID=3702 RepID=A0A7G2DYV1_ARATH|nr:unnamed protein product [Arabidopsis thaliana]